MKRFIESSQPVPAEGPGSTEHTSILDRFSPKTLRIIGGVAAAGALAAGFLVGEEWVFNTYSQQPVEQIDPGPAPQAEPPFDLYQ
jgi:hypothetical protein